MPVAGLLFLMLIIGESWQLFPETGTWYPCLYGSYNDTPQWVVVDLANNINWFLMALVVLIATWKNTGYRIIFIAFASYRFLDLCAWFLDHKQWTHYPLIYGIVSVIELIGYIYFLSKTRPQ